VTDDIRIGVNHVMWQAAPERDHLSLRHVFPPTGDVKVGLTAKRLGSMLYLWR
jgi:hypothetical protein